MMCHYNLQGKDFRSFHDVQHVPLRTAKIGQNTQRQCTMHFYIVLLQPTNAQIYITILSLYMMFTPTCFNTSVST
jgi:hypothetical protein